MSKVLNVDVTMKIILKPSNNIYIIILYIDIKLFYI